MRYNLLWRLPHPPKMSMISRPPKPQSRSSSPPSLENNPETEPTVPLLHHGSNSCGRHIAPCLEIFKNNARLELMYQTTAHQAFQFCLKIRPKDRVPPSVRASPEPSPECRQVLLPDARHQPRRTLIPCSAISTPASEQLNVAV